MRGARAFSLCSFKNTRAASKNIPVLLKKNIKKALASLAAGLPSQRDSGETRFFNTTRETTRNLLA
jgi:hypothetical protein